ncbi:ABC transporter transmembrane domain-containing protein, partial [Roseateles sp. P5_E11]
MSRLAALTQVLRLLRAEADRKVFIGLICTLLAVVVSGALAAATPLMLKRLVDAMTAGTSISGDAVWLNTAGYLLALLASRAVADIRPWLSGMMDQRLQSRLTRRFLDQLTRLPMGYLLKRRGGELLHSLELAAIGSQLVLSHMANSVLPVLIELMVMTWILISLGQPTLVIVFAATAATYLAIFTTGGLRMTQPAHEVSTASLNVYARLNEGITHLETLRCFGADEQARRGMHEATAALEARWSTLLRLNLGIAAAATATFAVSMALCLAFAADAVARQTMTVGGFVLASVYMLQMVRPLELLGSAARDLSRAIGFARPLLDILAEPQDAAQQDQPTTRPASAQRTRPAPSVTFEDLHFAYDPLRPLVNGLTLHVEAGRTTAIVGPSGSGKSSL